MTLNTTAETETAKIARGLRERDTELLADLVERCQHRLVRYLLYLTGRREYAEDLAQETWIRVLQRGSRYNGRQRFDPWLFAIARNLAIDDLRKKRKAVETASLPNDRDAVLLLPSSGSSPFEAAARSEDAMRLAGGPISEPRVADARGSSPPPRVYRDAGTAQGGQPGAIRSSITPPAGGDSDVAVWQLPACGRVLRGSPPVAPPARP
jgi:Sigma-70 region 2